MAVRCIGQVTTEHAGLTDVVLALGGIDDKKEKERTVSGMEYFYFQLGEKRYVPLTDDGVVDQSEKRCKTTLERSKRQPQPVGEVVQTRTEYASSYWTSWTKKQGDSKTYRDDSTESDPPLIGHVSEIE